MITITNTKCTRCMKCRDWCPNDAIHFDEGPVIDREECNSCGQCMVVCPEDAVDVEKPSFNADIYDGFAEVYRSGNYTGFSEAMADVLLDIMEEFDFDGEAILDIACGEGTFAAKMADKGYGVVGIDVSPKLIEIAGEKVPSTEFAVMDMRDLPFQEDFDVVTCWFDSLNYILKMEELKQVFSGVHTALRPGGMFVFDVNTRYVMEEVWDEQTVVKEDSKDRFDMVEQSYDEEEHIASLKLISFLRDEGECWRKIEEVHMERGYTLDELTSILKEVGFEILANWKDPEDMTDVDEETERAWFVLQKK